LTFTTLLCAEIEFLCVNWWVFFLFSWGSFVKVPWSRLGQEPVIVELDRIFVLAEPATDVEGGDADAVQDAKNARVKEDETKFVTAKQEESRKQELNNSSWLGSLISTIIGNLKLSITNIHIRYEDTESNPGHPFAVGMTLAKLAAVTVDDDGKETFVTGGSLDRIQKSGELNRLSFYFDTDSEPWPTDKPWEQFLPPEWSKIFEPGIKDYQSDDIVKEGETPSWIQRRHNYLLEPVAGTAQYFKLGNEDSRSPDRPAQKAVVILDDVTISLSERQYRDVLKLTENISTFSKRVQYAHYRPNVGVKEDARAWWQYSITAIMELQKKASGQMSWKQMLRLSHMRKQYVSKYVAALQANPDKITIDNNKEIQNLDRELDAGIILQWRMLAHTYVDQTRAEDAKRQQEEQAKGSWWLFGWFVIFEPPSGPQRHTYLPFEVCSICQLLMQKER
jgi:vacuolar protein sorting-associated protein 13A/C